MITEDYVSFETAKLLKEKGFDEPVQMYYEISDYPSDIAREHFKRITGKDMEQIKIHSLYSSEDEPFFNSTHGKNENQIACPTLQMAMKWLRETHNLHIEIFVTWRNKIPHYQWSIDNLITRDTIVDTPCLEKPEEAVEAAIKYCLENLI